MSCKFKFCLLGTFWNFFPPNIFDLQLVESTDVEPTDTKSQLYIIFEMTLET